MTHLKRMGLAATAVVVIAMMGTASASAAQFGYRFYTSEQAFLASTAPAYINVQGYESECSTYLAGDGPEGGGPAKSISLQPSIECPEAFGWIPVTVDTEGCRFKFYANFGSPSLEGCTSGAMTMKWYVPNNVECEISISNQSTEGAQYTNGPENEYLEIDVDYTFNAQVTTSKLLCPFEVGSTQMRFKADYNVYANEGLAEIWREMWVGS